MGTVYRTQCQHVKSEPQPTPAEYTTKRAYERAVKAWDKNWLATAEAHAKDTGCRI